MIRSLSSNVARRLAATYFAVDPRSLGLFRIVLGAVLILDLWQRYREVDVWYTDGGLIPIYLLQGGQMPLFSVFLHVTTHTGAVALMAACALVYVCFTAGVATRVTHALALVCVVSLNSRVWVLENGGHYVLNLLTLWSLFLPLGRRFSVDAWFRARSGRAPSDRPVWSLAVLALLLQFAVIYAFNALHKDGPKWEEGTAIHYALHDERVVTVFGVWIREALPDGILKAMTHGTLLLEYAVVFLILCPLFVRHLRLAAIVLLPALHLGFGLCLELGIFSYAMMSFYPLLLAPEHWRWWDRRRSGAQASEAAPRGVLRWVFAIPREALVVLLLVAAFGDLVRNNPGIPAAWRYDQPAFLNKIIMYPRIRQYWRMYAPDLPSYVRVLAVEAHTTDGRIVDPYNEVASRYTSLPAKGPMPVRFGQSQRFTDYSYRLHLDANAWLKPALRMWILRHRRRTGRPEDAIKSFELYRVLSWIPPPGDDREGQIRRFRLLSHP